VARNSAARARRGRQVANSAAEQAGLPQLRHMSISSGTVSTILRRMKSRILSKPMMRIPP
jgi:hypothetical protein